MSFKQFLLISFIFTGWVGVSMAQDNRIDGLHPDAPALAPYGDLAIGVRTIEVSEAGRADILNTERGGETSSYDRQLTLEVWYPAQLAADAPIGGSYQAITRNPEITATLHGKAVRDAEPLVSDGPYPLVIISHGYPGNRFLMSHSGENLASKGYVVVSIDHAESTYDDQQAFASTLYNRPLDQRLVLQRIAELAESGDGFLAGLVSTERTGIIGYSMGGYGLVNNLGGGYAEGILDSFMAPPNRLLYEHASSNPEYRRRLDSRITAGFAVAPWGMNSGFWQESDLAGIQVPTFYLAGSIDEVAGYENGTRAIYQGASNSDRYLLTFEGAGHNAGAPIPVPVEIMATEDKQGADHYRDPNWDTVLMNNIMDHFLTAWFDFHLKQDESAEQYLAQGASSVWGSFASDVASRLRLEYQAAQQ